MGALDDAIREHIELKRQHGASETDLERQAREALGPARREAPAPAEQAGEEAEVAGGEAQEAEADAGLPTEPTPDPAGEDFEVAEAGVPSPADEPEFDHEEPGVLSDPQPFAEPYPGAVPLPAEAARASPQDDIEDEDEDEDEDVLEETPEFLQETPEHDRLWFEQKPPRDFDFDDE